VVCSVVQLTVLNSHFHNYYDFNTSDGISLKLSRSLYLILRVRARQRHLGVKRGNDLAKAMDYMLKRWPAFTRFLDDGRICLSNNAAERALRGIPTAAGSARRRCTA
jgi:transposase IS66 family protein